MHPQAQQLQSTTALSVNGTRSHAAKATAARSRFHLSNQPLQPSRSPYSGRSIIRSVESGAAAYRHQSIQSSALEITDVTAQIPVNGMFSLPQIGLSIRRPSSPARSAALAEPSALEHSSRGSSPAKPEPLQDAVTRIFDPEELTEFLETHPQQLVVLMCKAHSCRPCKMFMRKYARIAQQYEDRGVRFLEIFGDDTKETRQLMMAMEIRVTPNFRLYRGGQVVHSLTGINETNLRNAVEEY